ncbi:MAG: glycosyltransferase 87 family protein [Bacteroidota bacterium]
MIAWMLRLPQNRFFWPILLACLAVVASLQSLWAPRVSLSHTEHFYTAYNNYVIFKQSFFHLIHHQSLYVLYPHEHWDLFKYSPTFALLFGAWAMLPDAVGLLLWNVLNAWVWWKGIRLWQQNSSIQIPTMNGWWLGLGALELITSLQNEQSNALIAGLLM